ncbi:DUF6182 family protein [Bradyrhizobium sp. CB1015]|uniref:DUF6182 family protein n=1 Tax=Bradyrhizobium sp. CB1015 TaxID=2976822 RepID=UPI0021AA8DE5|nr:DUF6182 family protein [Bradyrhizobium sp. CB1015]UWU95725.1 DUF6182 family protein [Bradyrhizobium sp. CB1015]
MKLTQEWLRGAFEERLSFAHPGLDRRDLPRTADHAATDWQSNGGVAAVAVLREFAPAAFAESCVRFAQSLDEDASRLWRRNFTRTIFLVGNPGRLSVRFAFDWLAADGSIGWIAPAPPDATLWLRRLLCLFRGGDTLADISDFGVAAPDGHPAITRTVYVATAGIGPADYLVHLNHILAEGVLSGELPRDCGVSVRHIPKLSGREAEFGALRIHFANGTERLRAYAGITRPDAPNRPADAVGSNRR